MKGYIKLNFSEAENLALTASEKLAYKAKKHLFFAKKRSYPYQYYGTSSCNN